MLFNSLHFLIFFPVVAITYFLLPHRWRVYFLLLASYFFYMSWIPAYGIILAVLTLIDYVAAIQIADAGSTHARKAWLIASITANLGLLFVFKYSHFFTDSITTLCNWFHCPVTLPFLNLLLPIGLSFHTFQSLGYVVDVYSGVSPPERDPAIYALYVAYFPQLVAGPIERSTGLLPQLRTCPVFDYDRITAGLRLMTWGFLKKVLIADHLAPFVNSVYSSPTAHSKTMLLVATYSFAVQIYCDFSGYTDIAIGAASVLGHTLRKNFDHPYEAQSVGEFWHRWHISLSTWFRDYVYIPLGGNRTRPMKWVRNILVTFLLSGLWHGAKWTFVLWGLLHAIYLLIGRATQPWRSSLSLMLQLDRVPRLRKALRIIVTFHLVTLAWIFFRANTVNEAFYILSNILQSPWSLIRHLVSSPLLHTDLLRTKEIFVLPFLALVGVVAVVSQRFEVRKFPPLSRWGLYVSAVLMIFILGALRSYEFIYFQF
jgi:alginate O-acetyltransferase complex protein AlgI